VRSEADVPKGHERVGSMNVGLRGSTTPKKPSQAGPLPGRETLTTAQGLPLECQHCKVLVGSVLEVILLGK
jgi:hypothetical protein